MKKIILFFVLAIFTVGCKSKSVTETKVNRSSQNDIKGNWTITSVTYPGSDYIKVTSFDLADAKCFVGSTWKFVSNNSSGTMALTKSNCPTFESNITWFINKEDQLVLKYLNGAKAKKMLDGYILGIQNQTQTSFELTQQINVGGKMVDVVYQFTKVQ